MNAWRNLLRQSANIFRPISTRSPSGETAWVYPSTALYSGIACNVQGGRGRFEQTDSGARRISTYRGFFLPEQDLKERDQVVVDGVRYDVVHVHPAVYPGTRHHLEVDLEVEVGAS